MKKLLAFILAAGMLLSIVPACGKKDKSTEKPTEAVAEKEQLLDKSETIAVIGKNEIKLDNLYIYMDSIIGDIQAQTGSEPGWENIVGANGYTARDVLIQGALDFVQQTYAFYYEAKQLGIYSDEEAKTYVDNRISEIGGNAMIEAWGYKTDVFREYLSLEYAWTKYVSQKCTLEEAIKQYNDLYNTGNFMYVKHILLTFDGRESEEATLTEANAIYERAVNGESFEALIDEFNEDPGSQNSSVGYLFTDGEMVVEFEDASKALKVGEISKPVRTDYGYHIIKKFDIPAEGDPMYDSKIEEMRITVGSAKLTEDEFMAVVDKYPIEFDESKFSKIDLSRYTTQ